MRSLRKMARGLFRVTPDDGTARAPCLTPDDPPRQRRSYVTNVGVRRIAGRRDRQPGVPGTRLLICAAGLLLLLAAAQGYVSWFTQYGFIHATKHAVLPSGLEALGLDAGAVIFALLALALAVMGRPARIERVLNVACALGSMTMNILAAELGSPRSVIIFALPSLLYVAASDRLIATVRRHALAGQDIADRSVWAGTGKAALYVLRLTVALPSTATGLRRWLLNVTPLPTGMPDSGEPLPAGRREAIAPGQPTKKAVLIGLYQQHADYGKRSVAARVASELAPQAGLQAGSARTALYAHLASLNGSARP